MSLRLILKRMLDADTIFDSSHKTGDMLLKLVQTKALNTADMLEFVMPPGGIGYQMLDIYSVVGAIPLRSIVELYYDDERVFRGRVLQSKEDLYRRKTTICEGEQAFLHDSVVDAGRYEGTLSYIFAALLTQHNARVDAFKRFELGSVSVAADATEPALELDDAMSTANAIAELIKHFGGYITFTGDGDVRTINWIDAADFGDNEQPIALGQNILDLNLSFDPSSFANRIYAFGKKIDDARVQLPAPGYVEDTRSQSRYGIVAKTAFYNDVENAEALQERALADLAAATTVLRAMTLSAIDLSRTGDTTTLEHFQGTWDLGKTVHISSAPHGIDGRYMLAARTIDYLDPRNDKITLGALSPRITGGQI